MFSKLLRHGLAAITVFASWAGTVNATPVTYLIDTHFQQSHKNGTGNYNPPGGALTGYFTLDTALGNVPQAITELSLTSAFPSPYGGLFFTTTYNIGLATADDTVGLSIDGSGNTSLTVRDKNQSRAGFRYDLTLNFIGDLTAGLASISFIPYENVKKVTSSGFWGSWGWQGPGTATTPAYSTATVAPVPEPSSYLMMGLGLFALGFAAVKRRQ